jgi:anaerobic magnesium-protoporphyrin IX monomethyl ester cyclase
MLYVSASSRHTARGSHTNSWKPLEDVTLKLDAIIISESGVDGLTGIVPERLHLDGRPCSIHVVRNYLAHGGRIVPPVEGDGTATWWSSLKLNGIYLLTYLTHRGFDVRLVNKYFLERDRFEDLCLENPRAVVISTTFTRSRYALRRMVEDIRSLAPGIPIIAGGPFVYYSYLILQRSSEQGYLPGGAEDDYLFFHADDPDVDLYVVSPLGEAVLAEALKRLKQGLPVDGLPNTARRPGGRYEFSPRQDDVSHVGTVPIDWRGLPDEVFSSGVVSIQASKGCPHRCAFCSFVKDPRMVSVKPLHELLDELRAVEGRGARYVWFVDDNFRLGAGDLNQVCRVFIEEGLSLSWMTMVRASTLKDVDPDLLRRSGCIEVQLGLESADPGILEKMNKKSNPELYRQVVQGLLKAGINCSCYFIFGFPGETDETALRTREFIKSIQYPKSKGTLMWSLFPFCLYPLSPIYEIASRKKYGLEGHLRDWRHRTMDAEQAMTHVREAFMELDDSCAVYRGDNLNMLLDLGPRARKAFLIQRHRLSKLTLDREITKDDVAAFLAGPLSMLKSGAFSIEKESVAVR